MKDPPYDQLKDLVPVATTGRPPWLLAAPTDSPFKSIDDVVKFGKANPSKLAFPFWQSSVLVTGETFGRVAGILLRKYLQGAVESTTTLLEGRLPIMFTDTIGARPQLDAGKIRVLETTAEKRPSLELPDAPTFKEAGYDAATDPTTTIAAPAPQPKPTTERLNKESRRNRRHERRGAHQAGGIRPRSTTMTLRGVRCAPSAST